MIDEPFKNTFDKDRIGARDIPQTAKTFWEKSLSNMDTTPIRGFANTLAETGATSQISIDLTGEERVRIQTFESTINKASKAFVLAAWALTLSVHTNADAQSATFAVVDTLSNRQHGAYPLHLSYSPETRFESWIYEVAGIDKIFSKHAVTSYEKVCAHVPNFRLRTMVNFVNGHQPSFVGTGPPITINVNLVTWSISASHNVVFSSEKVRVLLSHMKYTLLYIATLPTANINSLDFVAPTERAALLKFGQAQMLPRQGLIHRLVEQQAEIIPDAPAVQYEGDFPVTYRELNMLANAVARQIVCGRGMYIPICISRSVSMIIAMLGVLKTGAAYVLLSEDVPAVRNLFIVNEVRAPFIITDKTTQDNFSGSILVEELLAGANDYDRNNLNIYQAPSDIAYIIYTSGTTGKPKGVLLEHQAAYTGLCALPEQKNLRQLLCHSPVFSAAQRSIFGTLIRGGLLCLTSKDNLTVHLQDTIKRMRISSIEITPSMAALIDPSMSSSLSRITLGGESISPALAQNWAGRVELVNAYGLSENTQMNWRYAMNPGVNSNIIGRPTDSTSSYVLVPGTIRLSPILVPGELCLGGHQLARGYLNDQDKTNQSFHQNPFGTGRLYRTGDYAMCHEDGSIEILGRIDQQTKINGQRVEPGESAAIIQLHPKVVEACTVSIFVLNRKALVAVVVPQEQAIWPALRSELRASVRARLPAYAVPSYWIRQNQLPRNVNGKTDIALLTKTVESLDDRELLSLPRSQHTSFSKTATEEAVIKIVAKRLSMPSTLIDIEATFQDLGGSSLDAIHVASELKYIGISVTVGLILQAETIKGIAAGSKSVVSSRAVPPDPFALVPTTFNRGVAEDAYPATPLQEGIVADSVLGKGNYTYRRMYSFREISSLQLRRAFLSVVRNSSLLRTTFVPYKRTFMQIVDRVANLPWKEIRADIDDFLKSPIDAHIDVHGPLLRCTVLNGNVLVVDIHHAIFDFWSNHFIFEDINSTLLGQDPTARAPFSSYVQYQKKCHNERTRAFWEEYLRGAQTSNLMLVSPPHTSDQGFCVTSKVKANLLDNGLTHRVTLGALVHAAWAIVLSIHRKANDVHFAAAFSGRDADIPGILTLDGPTLCVVPMRIRLERSQTVVDFVQQVQTNHLWKLSEYAHYGMRDALLAGRLGPESFNTMVNVLVKTSRTNSSDQPLVAMPQETTNFTQYITIELDESVPDVVKLLVPFSADCLTAQSLVDQFAHILETLVENPTTSVGDICDKYDSISNQRQYKIEDGVRSYQRLAHASFEIMAALHPSKTAIRNKNGEAFSYNELNVKANSFAVWLHENGVQPGEMLPLYMEKSLWTLVVIFGIMKAGAAFTPLDPGNPHDRNAFIIKDIEAHLVITDSRNCEACRRFGLETVVIEHVEFSSDANKAPDVPQMAPESIVYAIYTSGSTGLPKGVLVQHSAVVAATEGMIEATGTTASWVSLWVLNYVFDASYYDVFTVLSAGGTLCLAPQDDLLSDLTGAINSHDITHVMLTPTITKLISGGSKSVPKLRVLNVCGEKIDANILEWAKNVDVYNGYGPTEATILMTVSKVLPKSNLNSIGFPLKHVTASIYYVDRVEQTPYGDIGELCVSGPQLAKGYLKRPEQSSAAFVSDENGIALYRTGDLARWHEDGYIECFGRKDYQVKLNGHRIELGEIENAILGTEELDACVVAVANIQHKYQLVAFCIFKGEHKSAKEAALLPPSGNERVAKLCNGLSTLSQYMIPTIWLPFSSFPTLPSGKTDRKKLVSLVEHIEKSVISTYLDVGKTSKDFRPVETELEKVMLQSWTAVLDEPEESIGATSNFVHLGGDSISAINVVAMSRNLGWSITVNDVLSNHTLAEQAVHLKAIQQVDPLEPIVYDVPRFIYDSLIEVGVSVVEDVEDIFPCGPGQVEFLTQGHNTSKQYWQLTVCRSLSEGFDLDLWRSTTTELTVRNQILRTTYVKSDPHDPLSWMQVVLRTPVLDWAEISYTGEAELQSLMEELRDDVFGFGKPAVKYRLFKSMTDQSRSLCIKLDHASYDGTLLRIFDDQFTAIARGSHTLDPPTDFKTFIDWNYRSDRDEALSYWTQLLHDYQPIRSLPTHRTQNGGLKFATVSCDVNTLASHFGLTASTIFQASYSILIGRLCGVNDVLFDNLLTGRNAQVENPQLVNGTCANFLPFRFRFNMDQPIRTLLEETQSLFWKTTEHGTLGLGDIYKALGQHRDEYSARLLYCFQPFEPATGPQGEMHWIVMAMSKVMMNINYVVMLEIQKTLTGYRVKMQYDADVLTAQQAEAVLGLYDSILSAIVSKPESTVTELFEMPSNLDKMWA